ncbi:MAG: M48 family metalloprotease [Micromonosporaceae bacterium]|nr:M48 family metalloprotease [Micromonosporaceae bacterium]
MDCADPAASSQPRPSTVTAGRPRHFPSGWAWLSAGMWRNWRGIAGALVATCLGLPVAIVVAAGAALLLGAFGLFGGVFDGPERVPGPLRDLPLLGSALETFLPLSSGLVGGLVGALAGLVLGFLGTVLLFGGFWFADDPVAGLGSFLGIVAVDLLIAAVYTGYRVAFEPWLLRATGARRLSRRERELILPIVRDCAGRMGLENHPPILVDDDRAPNAIAYPRHLVISRGLLAEFGYHPEVIAGVVSHLLVHWRNGDPISAAFVRGAALPLYLVHGWAGWAGRRVNHPLVSLVTWVVFWPVLLTVNQVIMPLQAVDVRRAEYRADQGAVLAGHRDGLRRVLGRLRHSFETGRNGWAAAVGATHPPNELRLERLEEPGRRYPLPDPRAAAEPEHRDDQVAAPPVEAGR